MGFSYHSEKLFNSIRSGCVTFYQGDPSLDLSHLAGGFIPLTMEAVVNRGDLAAETLSAMERFMFGKALPGGVFTDDTISVGPGSHGFIIGKPLPVGDGPFCTAVDIQRAPPSSLPNLLPSPVFRIRRRGVITHRLKISSQKRRSAAKKLKQGGNRVLQCQIKEKRRQLLLRE